MTDEARAFWVVAPGRGEIRPETLRAPADGDVVVRTLFSGISRGTEALVFGGHVPQSEWARMRAPFQEGEFSGAVKYGYANVGRIECGPSELEGKAAFVLYPHQTRYVVPASAVYLLPSDVPPARAVLAANLETALNGVWDASPQTGDRVVVIGAGTVGCLVAWLVSRIQGCDVQLVDVNPQRQRVGQALGVSFARPGQAMTDADIVIHVSGSPDGLQRALDIAGFEATIIEMSWFGDRQVPLPLGGAFHSRRLTIKSSQVGHVAAAQRSRWDTRRRMAHALSLLADPALDVLITGENSFEDLPDVMARLAQAPGDALCHRIKYQ
ncbi:MAG TPA: zinc-binding alcohol dehydrogenase [Vicinamibacterales bacterium]|nr:zinc-binding alcohol dehydrogenase [Vicinamibacterales bacterium]